MEKEHTCSHIHRTKRNYFVKDAKEDNISEIHYEALFFLTNLGEDTYYGINKISFNFSGNYESEIPLKVDFLGDEIYEFLVNGERKDFNYNGKYVEILKSELKKESKNQEFFIVFKGRFSLDKPYTGVGCYKYFNQNDGSYYVYTQSEPDFAQKILPLFYNLNHKAIFELRFLTFKSNSVISNMNAIEEIYLEKRDNDDFLIKILEGVKLNQKEIEEIKKNSQFMEEFSSYLQTDQEPYIYRKFEKSPIMAFNIMAFAVGPYVKYPCSPYKGKIPVEFYCQRGSEASMEANLKRLEMVTKSGLKFYEEYLKVDYPFTKYGNLFVPNFSFNAMENPGLVLIHQRNLWDPSEELNIWKVINRDRMILHEMAHMWMGNLYTMDEWHDLWLKEATAEYFCHKAFNAILADKDYFGISDGVCDHQDIWINFVYRTAINNGREVYPFKEKSFPVCFKDEDYLEKMMDFYGSIVYQKGSSYMKNLNFLIGEENFRELFNRVIVKFSYKNLSSTEFKAILNEVLEDREEELKEDIDNWFESHIHTKGYPILSVGSKTYEEDLKRFRVKVRILWPKWTKVRALLLGTGGRKQEVILKFGDNQSEKESIKDLETVLETVFEFENVNFEPLVFIPNYKFDDFVHCIFDLDSLKNLFCSEKKLYNYLFEDFITIAYVAEYLRQYLGHFKQYFVKEKGFLMNIFIGILETKREYILERNYYWIHEDLETGVKNRLKVGAFLN